jgi:hypothetical protein
MSADQTKACKALLANVVLLAIADATSEPTNKKIKVGEIVLTDQYTAIRFLFDEREAGVEAYAHWLDFDVDQFRTRLRKIMSDNSAVHVNGYSPLQRRNFRFNYAQWLANTTLELPEELNDD